MNWIWDFFPASFIHTTYFNATINYSGYFFSVTFSCDFLFMTVFAPFSCDFFNINPVAFIHEFFSTFFHANFSLQLFAFNFLHATFFPSAYLTETFFSIFLWLPVPFFCLSRENKFGDSNLSICCKIMRTNWGKICHIK